MGNPADFSNVSLQTNCEGTNGSTPTSGLDDSELDHASVFSGSAQISTSAAKFGSSSIDSNAAETRFTRQADEYHFADGDFTIEWFMRRATISANRWAISYYLTTGNQRSWGIRTAGSSSLEMFMSSTGSSPSVALTWGGVPVDSTFRHIAVIRQGSTLSAFVEGTRQATTTNSTNLFNASTDLRLAGAGGSSQRIDAFFDAIRITKGEALYDPSQTELIVPASYYPVGDVQDPVASLAGNRRRAGFFM